MADTKDRNATTQGDDRDLEAVLDGGDVSLHRIGAAEDTPLLDSGDTNHNGNGMHPTSLSGLAMTSNDRSPGTTSTGEATEASSDEEMERPWPATFERSISLLAGPTMDAKRIGKLTKSPKIGMTPLGAARFRKTVNLQRGYATPEPQPSLPMVSSGSTGQVGDYFRKGIAKVQSLDFGSRPPPSSRVDESLSEQQRKALEAKAYRQKLLAKHQGEQQPKRPRTKDEEAVAQMLSPGYGREKQSERFQKEMKAEEKRKGEKRATFAQCCFNMANILMGVGMLGLPFVFKSAGWIGGFGVTIGFGYVTWRTSILIGRELNGDPRPGSSFDDSPFKSPLVPGSSPAARMRKPLKSFPEMARESFGENGCIVLSSVLYFELFSCLCIFFVTLGDHLHSLFPLISFEKHAIIVAVVLTVPTALLRTPRLLSYLSAVGTVATVAVVLSVVSSAIAEGDVSERVAAQQGIVDDGPHHTMWRAAGLPIALGLIAYTFSGHAIVPSIYSSMERPQDFERMVDCTFLIVIGCCLLVAVSGYYMFGSMVKDQVTISLHEESGGAALAMQMLTWLMILTAFSKFTLTMFPLAIGVEEIVAPYISSEKVMETASAAIKLILIVLALLVAIFIPSFSFLCSLVGLICTMIVSVIFPAAAHLKLFGPKLSLGDKILDWIFVVVGTIMAVVGTIATV